MATHDGQSDESMLTDQIIKLVKNMSLDDRRSLLRELKERQGKEKRSDLRRSYPMDVNYVSEGNVYQDFIQDISPGGVFIETEEPFTIGQEISMAIPSSNHQKYIKIKGKVVRITPQGIGVEFQKKFTR